MTPRCEILNLQRNQDCNSLYAQPSVETQIPAQQLKARTTLLCSEEINTISDTQNLHLVLTLLGPVNNPFGWWVWLRGRGSFRMFHSFPGHFHVQRRLQTSTLETAVVAQRGRRKAEQGEGSSYVHSHGPQQGRSPDGHAGIRRTGQVKWGSRTWGSRGV